MSKVFFYNFNESELFFLGNTFKKIFPKSIFHCGSSDSLVYDAAVMNCSKADWKVLENVEKYAEQKKHSILFSAQEPDMFFFEELCNKCELYSSFCHLLICPESFNEIVLCAEAVAGKIKSYISKRALLLKKYMADYRPFEFDKLNETDKEILFGLMHEKMIKEIAWDIGRDAHYVEKRIAAIKDKFPDLKYPQFRHALLRWFAFR